MPGEEEAGAAGWAYRLVIFLRVMAALSMLKGLYHWAVVLGHGRTAQTASRRRARPIRSRPCSSR